MAVFLREVLHHIDNDGEDDTSLRQLITELPFIIPFEDRVKLFGDLVKMDQAKKREGLGFMVQRSDLFHLAQQQQVHGNIRRGHVLEDGFD